MPGTGLTRCPDVLLAAGTAFATLPAVLESMSGVRLAIATSDPSTHAAARQWRPVASGSAWLHSDRLRVEAASQRSRWAGSGLSRMYADVHGLVLEYSEGQYRVRTHCPNWLMVMILDVAYGKVADLQPPTWFRPLP